MKIPENAKVVFSGNKFKVYGWDQKMFDGSYREFERISWAYGVMVIAVSDGKVIVLDEEQPTRPRSLGVIGGTIEEGEKPIETAKRELLEETGYESDDWVPLKEYEPYVFVDFKIHLFLARNCRKVKEQELDGGEKITVTKQSIEDFMGLYRILRVIGLDMATIFYNAEKKRKFIELLSGVSNENVFSELDFPIV